MAEITSKTDLTFLSGKLNTEVSNFLESASSFESYVSGLEAVDGIDPTILGKSLCTSLKQLAGSSEQVAKNISNYIKDIEELDQYDQNNETENIAVETMPDTNTEIIQGPSTETVPNVNPETTPNVNPEPEPNTNVETVPNINPAPTPNVNTEIVPQYNPGGSSSPSTNHSGNNKPEHEEEHKPVVPIIPIIPPFTPAEGVHNGIIKTENIKSESGLSPQSSKKNIRVYRGNKNIDISKYNNDLSKGFDVTTGNLAYDLPEEDIQILSAIVAAQSDKSYDDALAIMSTILNRSETHPWIEYAGRDPMLQATAKNLFAVYNNGRYKQYLNNIPEPVYTAVNDCLKGVRNHKYLEINPNPAFSNNFISPTGNRFR